MKRALGRFFLLALAFFAAGCLQFKQQTMSYRYIAESDELRIFQNYEGIFGNGEFREVGQEQTSEADAEPKALSDSDKNDLGMLVDGQKSFFFSSWMFVFDREGLKNPDEDLPPELKKLFALMLTNVRIHDGAFYLDKDGKLCAVQSITCERFSELVAAVNRCVPAFFLEMEEKENTGEEADRKLLVKARQAGGWRLLEAEGNVVSLRWPLSRATYEKEFGVKSDQTTGVGEMREAGIGISWENDAVTFTLGKMGDKITELSLETSDRKYQRNALEAVRSEKHRIRKKFDTDAARDAFLLAE